jgi:hypothetical protein
VGVGAYTKLFNFLIYLFMKKYITKNISNLGKRIEPLFDKNKLHNYAQTSLPFASFSIELEKGEGDYDAHFGLSSQIMMFEDNHSEDNSKCVVSIKFHEKVGRKIVFQDRKVLFETDDFGFLEDFIKLIAQKYGR